MLKSSDEPTMGDRKVKEPSGGCFRTLARIGTLLKYDEAKVR